MAGIWNDLSANRKRDVGIIATVLSAGVLIALIFLLGWTSGSTTAGFSERARLNAEAISATSDERIRTCLDEAGADVLTCASTEIALAREHQRSELDLSAQQAMAEWALWMTIATIAGVVVSTIGVVLVAITFRETRKTTDAARRGAHAAEQQLLADTRPWLSTGRPTISINGTFEEIGFQISVKNIGKTPAHAVSVQLDIDRGLFFVENAEAVAKFAKRVQPVNWPSRHRLIFPGSERSIDSMDGEIAAQPEDFSPGPRPTRVRVRYCVTYRGSTDATYRTAGEAIFSLHHFEIAEPDRDMLWKVDTYQFYGASFAE